MTNTNNDKGIQSDEVLLYDEDGNPYKAATAPVQASILAALTALAVVVGLILSAVNGTVSDANSTSTPLAGGATFTGEAQSILDEGIVFVNVSTDQASAIDGLSIQQSSDGVNWDHGDEYTVPAGGNKNYSVNPYAEFLRVVYTNGATPQVYFRLQVIIKSNSLSSSHRIQDPIVDDDDAGLVTNVNKARKPDGTYINIESTDSGNLRVTDAESGLAIAKGDVASTSFIHKFGSAPDFDTADGFVSVWDGAEDGTTWELMDYVYSSTADIDTCSSSSTLDTQDLQIQGLDANYELIVQTLTLNGQNKVTITTPLIRTFRGKNQGSTDFSGHVFCYVDGTITAGVPDTNSDIRLIVQPENNQTLMSIFTIPSGKTGYMRDWYASTAGGSKLAAYVFRVEARPFGGVFQLKHISSLTETGTSYIQHAYTEPEVFAEKTDIQIKVFADASPAAIEASVSAGFDIVLVDN